MNKFVFIKIKNFSSKGIIRKGKDKPQFKIFALQKILLRQATGVEKIFLNHIPENGQCLEYLKNS